MQFSTNHYNQTNAINNNNNNDRKCAARAYQKANLQDFFFC